MKKLKQKQPRNPYALDAKMRKSAGPMGIKKGRKKDKEYGRLRSALEEALEALKEIEEEHET